MGSHKVLAYAKLNLFLDILGDENGYHNLLMAMQSISLYDDILFEQIPEQKISIDCDSYIIGKNIMEKTYEIFRLKYPEKIKSGYKITIKKNIPMGAGLGGGSADAAAMAKVIIHDFHISLDKQAINKLLKTIGADVPFCYWGGTKIAEGIGEVLSDYKTDHKHFLIINPGIHIETKKAFELWDKRSASYRPLISSKEHLIKSFRFYNAFEHVIFDEYPQIRELKMELIRSGATNSVMTGSGSTVFGEFFDKKTLSRTAKKLSAKYDNVYVVDAISEGVKIA